MKLNVKTTTAAVAVAGLIGAGVYVAVPAGANAPSTTTNVAAQGDGHPKKQWRRGIRGVHGEATVRRDSTFGKVAWQRGEITAVSGGTVTVRSADGTSWQWTTNQDTKVRKNKAKAAASALAVKDQVVVFGPLNGTTRTAKRVVVPKK